MSFINGVDKKMSVSVTIRKMRAIRILESENIALREHEAAQKIIDLNTTTISNLLNEVIIGNIRLVFKIISKYFNSCEDNDEIFSAGCYGLIKSVRSFDPDYISKHTQKNVSFSSYICTSIISEIHAHLRGRHIMLRAAMGQQVKFYTLSKQYLQASGNYNPSHEDILKHLLISTPPSIKNILNKDKMKAIEIGYNMANSSHTLFDVADDNENNVEQRDLYNTVYDSLPKILSDIEFRIIKHRYGVGGAEILTLRDISQLIGRSTETVRKIESSAIRKCRQIFNHLCG